ncbi:hypothetical protein ES705_47893 [subsurface metagenome]
MVMKKQIFTQHLGASFNAEGLDYVTTIPQTFVAQEDLKLIGCSIWVRLGAISQNDGESKCEAELSQNGVSDQPGTIAKAGAYEQWNTAPPFGVVNHENIVTMFAGDNFIRLAEADVVNLIVSGHGKSAGVSNYLVSARLYYIKG